MDVYNCFLKFLLVSGPRYTGKTLASIYRVLRHMWETPQARVGVFSKTIRTAKEGGIWNDLVDIAVPDWRGITVDPETGDETIVPRMHNPRGQAFDYTTINSDGKLGPKSDGTTRTMYFKIRNYWGGESTLLLFSLDNEAEAEARLKSTRFSCLYFPELSNFKTNKVYTVGMNQLRMFHLREDQHLWLADTNPSDEGQDSWIYDLFYKQRTDPDHKHPTVRDSLGLIEIFLDDNPYLSPTRRAEIEQSHSHDEGEYQRNVNGLWIKGHGKIGKCFAEQFDESIHVISPAIDILLDTSRFYTGWDIGDVNHGACLLERRIVNGKSIWMIIEERISIGSPLSTEAFAIEMLERIKEVEAFYGRQIIFEKHWSDDTAINVYRASSDTFDYLQVLAATGNRIELDGVQKPEGSVFQRIKIIQQLLKEHRIFVGANCPNMIEMFKGLQKGPHGIQKESIYKHAFDSLTYPIYMETVAELDIVTQPKPRLGLISIRS